MNGQGLEMKSEGAVDIAARMLGGENGTAGLLHYDLHSDIRIAETRCCNAGGRLVSRQALSAIILAWEYAHPGETAYGE